MPTTALYPTSQRTFPAREALAGLTLFAAAHRVLHDDLGAELGAVIADLLAAKGAEFDSFAEAYRAHTHKAFANVTSPEFAGATAVGTPGVDSTAALNNAITYLVARGGGTLFLPPGRYDHSGLTIPSNVIIEGAGQLVSVLNFTGLGVYGLRFKGTYTGASSSGHCKYSGARHIGVTGHGISVGISAEHASSLVFDSVRVHGVALGFEAYGAWDSVLQGDWRIDDCTGGMFFASTHDDPALTWPGDVEGDDPAWVDTNNWRLIGGTIESCTSYDIKITGKGRDGSGTGGQKPSRIMSFGTKIETQFIAPGSPRVVLESVAHSVFYGTTLGLTKLDDSYDPETVSSGVYVNCVDGVHMSGDCVGVAFINPNCETGTATPINNWFVFGGTKLCAVVEPTFLLTTAPRVSHVKFTGSNQDAEFPLDGSLVINDSTPTAQKMWFHNDATDGSTAADIAADFDVAVFTKNKESWQRGFKTAAPTKNALQYILLSEIRGFSDRLNNNVAWRDYSDSQWVDVDATTAGLLGVNPDWFLYTSANGVPVIDGDTYTLQASGVANTFQTPSAHGLTVGSPIYLTWGANALVGPTQLTTYYVRTVSTVGAETSPRRFTISTSPSGGGSDLAVTFPGTLTDIKVHRRSTYFMDPAASGFRSYFTSQVDAYWNDIQADANPANRVPWNGIMLDNAFLSLGNGSAGIIQNASALTGSQTVRYKRGADYTAYNNDTYTTAVAGMLADVKAYCAIKGVELWANCVEEQGYTDAWAKYYPHLDGVMYERFATDWGSQDEYTTNEKWAADLLRVEDTLAAGVKVLAVSHLLNPPLVQAVDTPSDTITTVAPHGLAVDDPVVLAWTSGSATSIPQVEQFATYYVASVSNAAGESGTNYRNLTLKTAVSGGTPVGISAWSLVGAKLYPSETIEMHRFSLASFLLVMEPGSSWWRPTNNDGSYDELWKFSLDAIALGDPTGPRVQQSTHQWRRDFERGFVVVNSDTKAVTIETGYTTPEPLTISGTPTSVRSTYIRSDGLVQMTEDLLLADGFAAASRNYVDVMAGGGVTPSPVGRFVRTYAQGGRDTNDGLTPATPFLTIGAAIASLSVTGSAPNQSKAGWIDVGDGVFVETTTWPTNRNIIIYGKGNAGANASSVFDHVGTTIVRGANVPIIDTLRNDGFDDWSHHVILRDVSCDGQRDKFPHMTPFIRIVKAGFGSRLENATIKDCPGPGVHVIRPVNAHLVGVNVSNSGSARDDLAIDLGTGTRILMVDHGLVAGDVVQFENTAGTGLSAETWYFVTATDTNPTGSTAFAAPGTAWFSVSTTRGGAAVTLSAPSARPILLRPGGVVCEFDGSTAGAHFTMRETQSDDNVIAPISFINGGTSRNNKGFVEGKFENKDGQRRIFNVTADGDGNGVFTFSSDPANPGRTTHGYSNGQMVQFYLPTTGVTAAGPQKGVWYFVESMSTTQLRLHRRATWNANTEQWVFSSGNRVAVTTAGQCFLQVNGGGVYSHRDIVNVDQTDPTNGMTINFGLVSFQADNAVKVDPVWTTRTHALVRLSPALFGSSRTALFGVGVSSGGGYDRLVNDTHASYMFGTPETESSTFAYRGAPTSNIKVPFVEYVSGIERFSCYDPPTRQSPNGSEAVNTRNGNKYLRVNGDWVNQTRLVGSGSPLGVVVADVGAIYTNIAAPGTPTARLWYKTADNHASTGWVQLT